MMKKVRREHREIAVYRGDELLIIGPATKCAKEIGISLKTMLYYMTKTGQRRSEKAKRYDKQIFVVDLSDLEL